MPRIATLISEVWTSSLKHTNRFKTFSVNYQQSDNPVHWELVSGQGQDVCSVLLFDRHKQNFILVKQFRPVVFLKSLENVPHDSDIIPKEVYSTEKGITWELCSVKLSNNQPDSTNKLCPKNLISLQNQVANDVGYIINESNLTSVFRYRTMGSFVNLFVGEVDDSLRCDRSNASNVDPHIVPLDNVMGFIGDDSKPKVPDCAIAMLWWLNNNKHARRSDMSLISE